MNKSIVQQIFYGNPGKIRAAAGGRGGNTITILLPGVGEERVTGLEGGGEIFFGKAEYFSNNLARSYSDGVNTQVSILAILEVRRISRPIKATPVYKVEMVAG